MTPVCPPPETLRRLGADSLATDAFRDLEVHLEACADCRARLESQIRLDETETSSGPGEVPTAPEIPGCVLGRELGRGGSGVVYEAVQSALGRRVAVKVLAAVPTNDARRRWLREARAIARVRHPNIVRLHEAGEHQGRLFLILDLIPGGTLRDRAAGRSIPPRDACRIVEAVALAVEESHRAGLLHLDVKPSNILMDGPPDADWADLTPMLSDFGIARDEEDAAGEGQVSGTLGARGTPAFMAPEQVVGRSNEIGPAADVHALGATLYALLTGRPPFLGSSPIETMDLLRTTEPAPPRALAPSVPRDLETICMKALEKSPVRRYASAAALADDLSRFREGRPILARPISTVGRLARWSRRRPASAALAAALAATIFTALIALTALWRRSEANLARAVQSEAAAERAVADLVTLVRTLIDSPERFASQRSADATAAVLDLTARLRKTPGLAARHAIAVVAIEQDLARWRNRGGDADVALRLFDDADDLLAAAAEQAEPGENRTLIEIHRVDAILQRIWYNHDLGRINDAVASVQLAERLLQPLRSDPRTAAAQADLQYILGVLHRERPDVVVAPSAIDDPVLRLVEALERSTAEWPSPQRRREAWAAYEQFPAGRRLPANVANIMYQLVAREIVLAGEDDARDPERFDAQATARRLAAALETNVDRLGSAPGLLDDLIEHISQHTALRTIAARRAGRCDEARRIIAWCIALGQLLSRRLPDSAGPHLMIGRAIEQEAKLAWVPPADEAAVESALRSALDEIALALALEPDHEEVRRTLAGLREKYLRLLAREPEPSYPPPRSAP